MSEHTPGPVIVGSFSAETGHAIQYVQTLGNGKQPIHVCECHSGRPGDATRDQRDANAEFIALAWNAHDVLLEACKMMLRLIEGESLDERFDGEAECLRAAIAKATGETT